ncbi:MAG: DUF481 domain-containing protein [Planctomycetota bacterium]|nr:DUF481 domain-containing protein [Planctomycetota bacterium]MEC8734277.1 DUF481 domain-containing protein [Planctomycetota bacterium]
MFGPRCLLILALLAFPDCLPRAGAQSGAESPQDGSTPKQVSVSLKNGDVIRGSLSGENDDSIIIKSPILGTVTLPRDQVDSVDELDPKTGKAPDPDQADSASSAVEKVKQDKPAGPFSGSLNIGMTYADASTKNLTLNVGGTIKYDTELSKFSLNGQYFYSRDETAVTDNDVIVVADQTWFLSKAQRWSIFAKGTYQWDQFEIWEQRVSPYGGFGYAIIKQEDLKTQLRLGAGGTYEYGESDRSWDTQLLFEVNTDWTIDPRSTLTGSLSFAPDVSDFDNYLLTLSAVYALKLFEDSPLTFNASVLNIYDSQPGADETGNDLKLILGLGWTF